MCTGLPERIQCGRAILTRHGRHLLLAWLVIGMMLPIRAADKSALASEENESDTPLGAIPLHRVEAATEWVFASDMTLSSSSLAYGLNYGPWEGRITGSLKTFYEEYRPYLLFDPLGVNQDLEEQTWGGQLEINRRLLENLTLEAAGGGYDGYDGYRSIWLNEYYRQQYGFLPAYEMADPKGWHAGAGLAWDYLPNTATLRASFRYYRDQVAPGYDIETDPTTGLFRRLVRGREDLDTWSFVVATENILTPWLRTRLQGQVADTTERESRYAIQGSANVALGDKWVWRATAGYTTERPTFDAWFLESALEWEARQALLLSVSGQYYSDTGEIVNSLQLSSAAPGLEAWYYGVGVRYLWPQASLKLFAGPYFTNYDPVQGGTVPFIYLYQDRDWWLAQVAFDVQF